MAGLFIIQQKILSLPNWFFYLSMYVEINQLINQQIKTQFLNCEWFNWVTDLH